MFGSSSWCLNASFWERLVLQKVMNFIPFWQLYMDCKLVAVLKLLVFSRKTERNFFIELSTM